MPRRKITPELWADILSAYDAWDPTQPGSLTVEQLLAPFGISKQAFYAERRRQGMANKGDWRSEPTASAAATIDALVQALVDAQLKIRDLERQLNQR